MNGHRVDTRRKVYSVQIMPFEYEDDHGIALQGAMPIIRKRILGGHNGDDRYPDLMPTPSKRTNFRPVHAGQAIPLVMD